LKSPGSRAILKQAMVLLSRPALGAGRGVVMRQLILLLGLVLACGLAFGDTITLNDGTVINGSIVMQDDECVIVKTTKGGTRRIDRREIKKLEKTGEAVKLTRKKYECRRCYDSGRIKCPDCGGTGKAKGPKCPDCSGVGRVPCPTCKGARVIKCGRCKGSGSVMVPARYTYSRDRGSTYVAAHWKKCELCGGRGTVPCAACKGRGALTCRRCNGVGHLPSQGNCGRCDGTGKIPCPYCDKGRALAAGSDAIVLGGKKTITDEAEREKRIETLKAHIAKLQAELNSLQLKEPSAAALNQYMTMSEQDRADVKMMRDRLRGADGYSCYCKLSAKDTALIRRSLLLQELVKNLGFAERRAREELR